MSENDEQDVERALRPRYRIGFFNYQHDFPGHQNYRGPTYGYFMPHQSLVVLGWVVPDIVRGHQSLQLQVIQGGGQC